MVIYHKAGEGKNFDALSLVEKCRWKLYSERKFTCYEELQFPANFYALSELDKCKYMLNKEAVDN